MISHVILCFSLPNYACATRVIADDEENVSLDRGTVNVMQMRYAKLPSMLNEEKLPLKGLN